MKKRMKKLEKIIIAIIFIIVIVAEIYFSNEQKNETENTTNNEAIYKIENIPEYNGKIYIEINNNNPTFTTEDMNIEKDYYSKIEDKRARKSYDKN